jgi:hypothetical protein
MSRPQCYMLYSGKFWIIRPNERRESTFFISIPPPPKLPKKNTPVALKYYYKHDYNTNP